jgi:hypothetical protein
MKLKRWITPSKFFILTIHHRHKPSKFTVKLCSNTNTLYYDSLFGCFFYSNKYTDHLWFGTFYGPVPVRSHGYSIWEIQSVLQFFWTGKHPYTHVMWLHNYTSCFQVNRRTTYQKNVTCTCCRMGEPTCARSTIIIWTDLRKLFTIP